MTRAIRISGHDARRAVAENDALLICAYDDREKCGKLGVHGSLAFPDFQQELGGISRDRELIFFCA